MPVDRSRVLEVMRQIQSRQRKPGPDREDQSLREIDFRSLDFSELILRLEEAAGRELDLDGVTLRAIRTVGDAVTFFSSAFEDHEDVR